MDKITAMISSTIRDLVRDRTIVLNVLRRYPFISPIGAFPVNYSLPGSTPKVATIRMAKDCDLFVLILGGRYGYVTNEGKSATEIEFEAAYFSDPTKIIVLVKKVKDVEPKQAKFIQRVLEYVGGYWKHEYNDINELERIFEDVLNAWISQRIHSYTMKPLEFKFISAVLESIPYPNSLRYQISESDVGFAIGSTNEEYILHVSRDEIRKHFWKTLDEVIIKLSKFLYNQR